MLVQRRSLVPYRELDSVTQLFHKWPLQGSTRCLGLEIDSKLKLNKHVSELDKQFIQTVNLLKSFYFFYRLTLG